MKWSDGRTYQGTFKKGLMHDYGRLEEKGEIFEGYFKHGLKDYIGKQIK